MFASNTSHSGEQLDAQFNYVTMLLPGNGTNGAQNNTFLDASTNNFTITRNGNTTQGSFSPYGSLWSNYFDGDADYLTLGANSAFAFGTGDFTVECWINTTTKTADTYYRRVYMTDGPTGNAGGNFQIAIAPTTGYVNLWDSVLDLLGTTDVCDGSWHHIAAVRSGTTLRLFVDGVQQASTTYSTSVAPNSGSPRPYIGTYNGGEGDFGGHISNLRVVKGTALYTSAFTPSTTPLTAVSGTSLLTCQSNRFIDNSANNFTITPSGSPQVTNFAPFNPTAAYSTATNGGSGYFDGSGDSLSAPDNTALEMGSSDFTMEAWLYPNDSGWQTILTKSADTATAEFQFYAYNNAVNFFGSAGSTWNVGFYTGAVLVPKAWNHVAVTRSGSNWTIWVNGVSQATATASFTISNNTSPVVVGAFTNGVNYATGYLTDVRIVKGTAVYTSAFTPPTAPLTAITNTSLLLNFTNGAIFDNSMKNDLETVGNAQISTSVKKFGTGSIYVDGTGDWLFARSSPNISLSGNFTIEGWVYQVSNGTSATLLCIGDSDVTGGIALYLDTTSSPTGPRLSLLYNSAILNGSTAAAINTWHHIAAVRSGSTITLFLNGVSQGTVSASTTFTGNLLVGATLFAGTTYPANNYIDDLRITKGIARYTANFTPPTSQLQDQ